MVVEDKGSWMLLECEKKRNQQDHMILLIKLVALQVRYGTRTRTAPTLNKLALKYENYLII